MIIYLIIGTAFINQSFGGTLCNTVEECTKLKTKIESNLQEIYEAISPNLSGILKKNVKTKMDAKEFCKNRGMLLPFIRDYAEYAQTRGAKMIETKYPNTAFSDAKVIKEYSELPPHFYAIYKKNSEGTIVINFYYSTKNYNRPLGDLGNDEFWTSSSRPKEISGYLSDYIFLGKSGDINSVSKNNENLTYQKSVRCLKNETVN
ncbi:MAG: hypothetical protein CL678_00185 [Bdellovibrionaceae bacterium]|nr:hypothetical protein [Pseudobdellovibrionaceae bacterium]